MQLGRQFIPTAAKFDHVFSKKMKHNRVELVSDFPNDAEVISSLQIHPQGWCALSRNTSYDESTEFTCLHDIQHRDYDDNVDDFDSDLEQQRKVQEESEQNEIEMSSSESSSPSDEIPIESPSINSETEATQTSSSTHPDIWAAEVTVRDRFLGIGRTNAFRNNHVYGITSGVLSTPSNLLIPAPSRSQGSRYRYMIVPKKSIPQNVRRMLYSIEQPNKGKGLIKEECFSSDGRLICSPYDKGFRLLSFSDDCLELPKALQKEKSHKLNILKYFKCHSDIVVSTRFSPIQPLLASGCLQGNVVWHQPRF